VSDHRLNLRKDLRVLRFERDVTFSYLPNHCARFLLAELENNRDRKLIALRTFNWIASGSIIIDFEGALPWT